MIQFLLHVFGDYVTQNNWMAQNKVLFTKKGWLACFLHATIYSLPFLFIVPSVGSFLVIYVTHFIIDKFRLAKYWLKFVNWDFKSPIGFPDSSPAWLSTWILIIVDNFFHITINYLSIKYI